MSQRNAPTAVDTRNVNKPADKTAAKKKEKGSGGKVLSIIIIVLLLAIAGYESYLLFGGNNFQATLAVITQGRSFLDIADEELLRQKQNVANQQAELDQQRQEQAGILKTLDKKEKSLDKRQEEMDAWEADLNMREQAALVPQMAQERIIKTYSTMDDATAASMLIKYSDMNEALNVMRGLKDTKITSILAAMASIDPAVAAKFAEQLPNVN